MPAVIDRIKSLKVFKERTIEAFIRGAPLPAGAVCNCGSGRYSQPVRTCTRNTVPTGRYCSCNKICTCIPVK